jgi:hypothetical protein
MPSTTWGSAANAAQQSGDRERPKTARNAVANARIIHLIVF